MKNKKVWFVTGCSKGLGHALVNELLEQGYMVSATSRNKQALIEAFGNESEQFLPLSMNLADEESVKTALKKYDSFYDMAYEDGYFAFTIEMENDLPSATKNSSFATWNS